LPGPCARFHQYHSAYVSIGPLPNVQSTTCAYKKKTQMKYTTCINVTPLQKMNNHKTCIDSLQTNKNKNNINIRIRVFTMKAPSRLPSEWRCRTWLRRTKTVVDGYWAIPSWAGTPSEPSPHPRRQERTPRHPTIDSVLAVATPSSPSLLSSLLVGNSRICAAFPLEWDFL